MGNGESGPKKLFLLLPHSLLPIPHSRPMSVCQQTDAFGIMRKLETGS